MLDHLSNQSENLLSFVVVARNPRRACPLLSLLFLAHEFFFEKEIQASQKNLKDFQDVITTVLLHFPHSLTSISHQKKKKKRKFSGPRHSSPSASFLEKSLMPPPTSQPNLLQCSPNYTWPGTKSLTHEEEEESEFSSANEVWVHGGDKAVHQLTA